MTDDVQIALLREFRDDRWRAHRHLFAHRHPDDSADMHRDLIEAINRPVPRLSIEGFRGCSKTTSLEETALLKACYREFNNMVIIGPSFPRACDKVGAIKNEIDVNPYFTKDGLFGELRGEVWQDGKIVLSNGVCIQALGRDQSITGLKFRQWRPDAFLIDDIEDPEEKRSDLEREETWRWLMQTFYPSLASPAGTWGRFSNTRRGNNSLPERLERAGTPTVKYPIEYLDGEGERRATWPARFPLSAPVGSSVTSVDELIKSYAGDMDTYMQEYMCEATSSSTRMFRRETMRVVPRVRTWEACYSIYDPARTIGAKSAMTGKAVASWIGRKLVVWAASGHFWMPSELIADLFDTNERFGPIWNVVEEDGLNQWLKEPLRAENVRRGALAPILPIKAPRDKDRFIGQLEPHFTANEVELVGEFPDLVNQLLSFTPGRGGRKDIPNALAYMLMLRPGAPIYDGFTQDHIAETVLFDRARPLWLACNATRGMVTAVALQYAAGRTRILADWAIDSEPGEAVPLLAREIGMNFRVAPLVCVGAAHYDKYMNTGLVQAFQRVPLSVERGVDPMRGRETMRAELGRLTRGEPAVQIARAAKLTLNAMAGGYSRALVKSGGLGEEAEAGLYRVLMEGVETCLGRMAVSEEVDKNANWSTTTDGRRYLRYGNAHGRR